VKLAIAALVAIALIYVVYQAFDGPDELTDHVLVLDGSLSFADEIETCPGQLGPVARRAAAQFDRVLIASFAKDALGRPWAYEIDFQDEYDSDRKIDEVEFATREEWFSEQAMIVERELERIAGESTERGSALLEQLERIAMAMDDRGDRNLEIVICSDGEIVDEGVDIREDFDQAQAVELWSPRLTGLEGARLTVVGFGRGLEPDENRRSREFLTGLLNEVGVPDVEIGPGSEG
jgi:hypothetical protein